MHQEVACSDTNRARSCRPVISPGRIPGGLHLPSTTNYDPWKHLVRVWRKGSLVGNSFDVLQDQIQSLTICAPEFPFVIRELLKHVLGRVHAPIFPNPILSL